MAVLRAVLEASCFHAPNDRRAGILLRLRSSHTQVCVAPRCGFPRWADRWAPLLLRLLAVVQAPAPVHATRPK